MPELPEVEVIKKSLQNKISNYRVLKVSIKTPKLRYKIIKKSFSKLIGKKILFIKRRSKYLVFKIEDYLMIVHLGMTGKFFIEKKNSKKIKTSFYYQINKKDYKYDRVIFYLNKKTKLIYNDVRKFGFIKIIELSEKKIFSHFSNLGPEPFSKQFNLSYFKSYVINKKKNVKNLLMDQRFVAGLGNIYVNEVLFSSKINPYKKCFNLNSKEILRLIKNIKLLLNQAIKKGGSSIKNFKAADGIEGSFQQKFRVYSKEGNNCPTRSCKNIIARSIISNRSTFYCKSCQK